MDSNKTLLDQKQEYTRIFLYSIRAGGDLVYSSQTNALENALNFSLWVKGKWWFSALVYCFWGKII